MDSGSNGWIWLATFLIFWILPSFLVARAAAAKRRSFWAFFFISVFFSWMFAGIIVAIMRKEA